MSFLNLAHASFLVFGTFSIIGGLVGFVKAKSKASLIAGGISGALLITAALWMAYNNVGGLILGGVVSLLLAGRFGGAMKKKGASGIGILMVVFGCICMALTAAALLRDV